MWLPSPVPPIESALNLFYDAQNNPEIFSTVTSPIQQKIASNLNYLIDYNFDTDFIATRMNLMNSSWGENSEGEDVEEDGTQKPFHMCKSAIVKGKESSGDEIVCGSDGELKRGKRRRRKKRMLEKRKSIVREEGLKELKNYMSVIVSVEKAQLKAFVLNKIDAAGNEGTSGSMTNLDGKIN